VGGDLRVGVIADSFEIAMRDLKIEARRAYEIFATIFFAISSVVLASIAWSTPLFITPEEASASIWIIIFFTSILLFTTSFAREMDRGTIGGLRTLPCSPLSILIGKVLYSITILVLILAIMMPLSIAFLNVQPSRLAELLFILVFGVVNLSLAGSFVSSIVMYSEGKVLLLPFLLFPILMPVFVPSLLATEKILRGMVFTEYTVELRLLGAFLLLVVMISFLIFERVLEE